MITRRKLGKWALVFFVGASVIMLINTIIISRDEAYPGVEAFVRNNEGIISHVGAEPRISLHKWVNYFGTPTDPAYREYRLTVKGDKGEVFIVVRAYKTESVSEPWRYVIVR